jgi:riboflavin kinase/FMN adenylyltransferase
MKKISSCALTIGNFDGVHLGHQALIAEVVNIANALKIPSVLMTFEPHPDEFFTGKSSIRLMRPRDKYQRLHELGIDYVLRVRFNREFSAIDATDFVEDFLLKQLGMRALVIGDDFRFGAKRSGDIHLLEKLSKTRGFSVSQIATLMIDGERVSSTRIRVALAEGNFRLVEKLLGRPYHISGRVTHGDKRGRQLGYPTANIVLPWKNPPIKGVFTVQVKGLSEQAKRGVASLGNRPMFDGARYWLEVHIFDFNQEIYGQLIEVEFLEKLRDEKVFGSVEELIQQMDEDASMAKKRRD